MVGRSKSLYGVFFVCFNSPCLVGINQSQANQNVWSRSGRWVRPQMTWRLAREPFKGLFRKYRRVRQQSQDALTTPSSSASAGRAPAGLSVDAWGQAEAVLGLRREKQRRIRGVAGTTAPGPQSRSDTRHRKRSAGNVTRFRRERRCGLSLKGRLQGQARLPFSPLLAPERRPPPPPLSPALAGPGTSACRAE